MHTSLRIDGANCPACLDETLHDLAALSGVRAVHGSLVEACIEVDHDSVTVDALSACIRSRLHGIEMFSSEIEMVPIEPFALTSPCAHDGGAAPMPSASHSSTVDDIDPAMTLGDIVTLHPSLAADLERHGLDYCCRGGRTLAEAAGEAGLQAQAVADELSAACVDEPPAAWAGLGPIDLVDHIETVHHHYLRAAFSRIGTLVDKIVVVHGERHRELVDVQRLYAELRSDLEAHLTREEQLLFPKIRQLADPAQAHGQQTEQLTDEIEALVTEHDTVGEILAQLRRATGGYATPPDACATYAACYRALAELEADTHLHVHKESNVLFPAVRTSLARGPVSGTAP